jgi:DnaJ-domain-containing protein 1
VALLFKVNDIAELLGQIELHLRREDEEEDDVAEIEAMRRRHRENSERLRVLAEKGLADLERTRGDAFPRPASTSDWLRELAEKAQAELDECSERAG